MEKWRTTEGDNSCHVEYEGFITPTSDPKLTSEPRHLTSAFLDLFRVVELRRRTLVMGYAW